MITANVTIMFEAETPEEVSDIVNGWVVPEGGTVHVITTEQLLSGTVVGGEITPAPPPEAVEPPPPNDVTNGAGTETM